MINQILQEEFQKIYQEAETEEIKENIRAAKQLLVDSNILREMSTVCRKSDGYGIVIQIYSDDHEPAHAHVFETEGTAYRTEIGEILITDDRPKTIDSLIIHAGNFNRQQKEKIVLWANTKKDKIFNWTRLKIQWQGRLNF